MEEKEKACIVNDLKADRTKERQQDNWNLTIAGNYKGYERDSNENQADIKFVL